jgi:hypothetical protein
MGKGRPRTTNAVVEAKRAIVDALKAGTPLPEEKARELVNRLAEVSRSHGWSTGYNEGQYDAEYDD